MKVSRMLFKMFTVQFHVLSSGAGSFTPKQKNHGI